MRCLCCEILSVVACQKNASITTDWDKHRYLTSETEGLTPPRMGWGSTPRSRAGPGTGQGEGYSSTTAVPQQTHGLVLEAALELNCLQEYSCKFWVVELLRGAKWQNNALGCLLPGGEKKGKHRRKASPMWKELNVTKIKWKMFNIDYHWQCIPITTHANKVYLSSMDLEGHCFIYKRLGDVAT